MLTVFPFSFLSKCFFMGSEKHLPSQKFVYRHQILFNCLFCRLLNMSRENQKGMIKCFIHSLLLIASCSIANPYMSLFSCKYLKNFVRKLFPGATVTAVEN